ncbi:MAG: hypothetical protein IPI60_01890 [Saprospiraceae bacterium]|nr:hypothetical protein [Saprospiraceae bacterium]
MDSLIWISFIGFILSMLALDLFALNRKAHILSLIFPDEKKNMQTS